MKNKKILCIDDDQSVLDLLVDTLTVADFSVDTADNGKIGLKKALNHTYDGIICDLRMPGLDGIKLVGEMKNSSLNKDTPVFVVSGALDLKSVTKLEKLGVLHCLSKPFRSDELMSQLEKAIFKVDEPIGYHPEVVEVFTSSMKKIFKFYLGDTPIMGQTQIRRERRSKAEFSAILPIFGRRLYGSISLSWDQALSNYFAVSVLNKVDGELTGRLRMEVIAETLKQIGQEAKTQFESKDLFISLGLPEVYRGVEHKLLHKVNTPRACIPFSINRSQLFVEFALGYGHVDSSKQ